MSGNRNPRKLWLRLPSCNVNTRNEDRNPENTTYDDSQTMITFKWGSVDSTMEVNDTLSAPLLCSTPQDFRVSDAANDTEEISNGNDQNLTDLGLETIESFLDTSPSTTNERTERSIIPVSTCNSIQGSSNTTIRSMFTILDEEEMIIENLAGDTMDESSSSGESYTSSSETSDDLSSTQITTMIKGESRDSTNSKPDSDLNSPSPGEPEAPESGRRCVPAVFEQSPGLKCTKMDLSAIEDFDKNSSFSTSVQLSTFETKDDSLPTSTDRGSTNTSNSGNNSSSEVTIVSKSDTSLRFGKSRLAKTAKTIFQEFLEECERETNDEENTPAQAEILTTGTSPSELHTFVVGLPDQGSLNGGPQNYCGIPRRQKTYFGRSARGERNSFSCSHCGKPCYSSIRKETHEAAVHRKERLPCSSCEKTFSFPYSLEIHFRETHLNEKRYKCVVCSKEYFRLSDMKAHLVLHQPENRLKCPHCDRTYGQAGGLKGHIKQVHLNQGEKCEICGKQFAFPSSLKRHIEVVHSHSQRPDRQDLWICNKTSE